VKGNIVRWYVL